MGKAKRKTRKAQPQRRVTWEPRDGLDRPTHERRRRGAWVMVDGETAGESYAVDQQADQMSRLKARGQITARQAEAGYRYEELARAVMGSPSTKDSIANLHRVDGDRQDVSDEPTPEEVANQREWRSLVTLLAMDTQRALLRTCWEQRRPSAINRLRLGLDIAADFWRIG